MQLGALNSHFLLHFAFVRSCYVTNPQYKVLSKLSKLVSRCDTKHAQECDLVTNSGPLCKHYLKTYGINQRSVLTDISLYSMFSGGLPHDIMHDVLEGVAQLEKVTYGREV